MEKGEIIEKVARLIYTKAYELEMKYADLIYESVSDYLKWFDAEELEDRFRDILQGGESE